MTLQLFLLLSAFLVSWVAAEQPLEAQAVVFSDLFEAPTTATLGLNGPVESIETKRFAVQNGKQKQVEIALPDNVVSLSYRFNKAGLLSERIYLDFKGESYNSYSLHYENDRYLGYTSTKNTLEHTYEDGMRTSSRLRDSDGHIAQDYDYTYFYDDNGRLIKELQLNLLSGQESERIYEYAENGNLIRNQNPNYDGVKFIYSPDGLLQESLHYLSSPLYVENTRGEDALINEEGKALLRTKMTYIYDATNELIEVSIQQARYDSSNMNLDLIRTEHYEANHLTTVYHLENGSPVARDSYIWQDNRLSRLDKYAFKAEGEVKISSCIFSGFDTFNNWTELRCAAERGLGEPAAAFEENLWLRDISYY